MKTYITSLFLISINLLYAQTGWVSLNSGTVQDLFSVSFVDMNTGYVVGENGTARKTTDGGITWIGLNVSGSGSYTSVYFNNVQTGFISNSGTGIYKTTDGGNVWTLQPSSCFVLRNDIKMVDINTGFVVGQGTNFNGRIAQTSNGGINWVCQSYVAPEALKSIFPIDANLLYAVGTNGRFIKSTNGGLNWTEYSTGFYGQFNSVWFTNANVGYIVISFGQSLLMTTNGGFNWIDKTPAEGPNLYTVHFPSSNIGYVAGRLTDGVIYKTSNSGLNFYKQIIPNIITWYRDIYFLNENTGFCVGRNGVILKTIDGGGPIGIQSISNEVPSGFYLEQNYPNPFNPNTNIQFSIPKSSFAKLTVYDITGRMMAILVNEELKPGVYEVDWDASHRASGIYYYKLEAESFSETRKMALLK